MARGHVGVDIGATEVRVVEISRIDEKGLAIISKIAVSPLPEGAIVGGRVRNAAQIAFALRSAIKLARVPKYGFVLGFSAPDIGVYKKSLPALIQRHEREGALRAGNNELNSSVPVADAAIATYLIKDEPADSETLQNIGITYVRESDLQELLGICDLAGLEPRAVDLSACATMRSIVRVNEGDNVVSTLIDLGASKTSIITRQGAHIRSIRVLPVGGNDITKAIAAGRQISFPAAEKAKYDIVPNNTIAEVRKVESFGSEVEAEQIIKASSDPGASAAANTLRGLVDQIASAVEDDATRHSDFTSGIALCGLGSLQKGLREAIQLRLGVQTMISRPWARIEKSNRNAAFLVGEEAEQKLLLSLATAVGLAMWRQSE